MEARNPFTSATVVSRNTSPAAYHKQGRQRGHPDFVMSRSELMEFYRCPRRWIKGYHQKDTDALAWGSLMDCLIMQPDAFRDRYALPPATYPAPVSARKGAPMGTKEWTTRADYCKEWEAERRAEGRTVLKNADYADAKNAVSALTEDPEIAEFLEVSECAVMVMAQYKDAPTGLVIPLKILIDLVPGEHSTFQQGLGDFKSCESGDLDAWARSVFTHNYHVQAAIYLDVYEAATKEGRTDFFHIIQESFEPYEQGRHILASEFIELGRLKYQNALREYAACLATNHWPTYGFARPSGKWNGWQFTKPQLWMMNA